MSTIHRNEYTGNAGLDRVQGNVRDVVAKQNALEKRIAVLENAAGVGVLPLTMGNVNYTLSAAELAKSVFVISGTHTGTRTLTVYLTDATRWFVNLTGFTINVIRGDGTVASISNGVARCVAFSAAGARVLA